MTMNNTVIVSVSSVLFQASDGATIFSGHAEGLSVRIIARGGIFLRAPVVGEIWEVTGRFHEHPKYGKQLYACSGKSIIPQGRLLIKYLASHPDFVGVGKTKAKALYGAFGSGLVDILNAGDREALAAVVTSKLANRIIRTWAMLHEDTAVIAYLDKYGFDLRLASKVKRVWGAMALGMLKSNPYYMLAFSSWKTVDSAAMKMGIAVDDPRRLIGAVEALLYERLQVGHTLTSFQKLQDGLSGYLGSCLSSDVKNRAIRLALHENAIVGDSEKGYQTIGAASIEKGVANRIKNLVRNGCSSRFMRCAPEEKRLLLEEVIAQCECAQGFCLNQEQKQAVHLVFTEAFSVITGGAGVGKTTVLRAINAAAKKLGIDVVQMALAGRAAKRMAELTQNEAITIARFLHQNKSTGSKVSDKTLVIIDEASMLDLTSAYKILSVLPDSAHVVLVGDSAQLPPIGFGLVFHQLVKSDNIPFVELTEVHRQAEETGIPKLAASIRKSIIPIIPPYTGKSLGVSFIDCDSEKILSMLKRLSEDWCDDEYQILAATRQGSAGINKINSYFCYQNRGKLAASEGLMINDPVIHLRNDYDEI